MDNELEEVEKDYIEFLKEIKEGECRTNKKQHIKKSS
jgi:hypothetical protein